MRRSAMFADADPRLAQFESLPGKAAALLKRLVRISPKAVRDRNAYWISPIQYQESLAPNVHLLLRFLVSGIEERLEALRQEGELSEVEFQMHLWMPAAQLAAERILVVMDEYGFGVRYVTDEQVDDLASHLTALARFADSCW